MPLSPPMTNIHTKASAFSMGTVNWIRPPHRVPSQLNVLMAEGTAMIIVVTMKRHAQGRVHAADEHVVPVDHPGQERDGDHREGHGVVPEDRLAGEDREDLGGDAHGGQDQDVDLRVPEVPEQVLPEQRLAAARRIEPVGAQGPVEQQHGHARGQHGQGQEQQDGRDEERPHHQGHPEQPHARGAHVDDGGDVVDRAHHGADAHDEQADAPEILTPVGARVFRHRRQRRVGGPAGRGVAAGHEEARQHQQARR